MVNGLITFANGTLDMVTFHDTEHARAFHRLYNRYVAIAMALLHYSSGDTKVWTFHSNRSAVGKCTILTELAIKTGP